MDDHFDIGRVFEICKFDITRLTCSHSMVSDPEPECPPIALLNLSLN